SDATSGLASLSYRVAGLVWATCSGAFVLTDGRHLVEYFATDFAGLSGPIQSLTVAVGTTPPATVATLTGQAGSNGWFVSNVTVILNATDALSGIANVSYRIDNGSWQAYSAPFLLAEGLHQVDVRAIDLAGITDRIQSITLDVHTTGPSSSAALSGRSGTDGWYISTVTVFLNATDSTSGVATVTYRVDQASWQLYLAPFVLTEGEHQIAFFATDVAGNACAPRSAYGAIHSTPPTTSAALSRAAGSHRWLVRNAPAP